MGVRSGQGYGASKPKRKKCPACGKHGVTEWQAGPTGLSRYCQYCQAAWGEAGWAQAKADAQAAPKAARVLTLSVKGVYFDQMAEGTKVEEFRLVTDFWRKRLEGRGYDKLVITKGYPKAGDSSRRLEFSWNGFERRTLQHPHFGPNPVEVYAISLAKPLTPLPGPAQPDVWSSREPQPHAFKTWFGGGSGQPHCASCGQLASAAIHLPPSTQNAS